MISNKQRKRKWRRWHKAFRSVMLAEGMDGYLQKDGRFIVRKLVRGSEIQKNVDTAVHDLVFYGSAIFPTGITANAEITRIYDEALLPPYAICL